MPGAPPEWCPDWYPLLEAANFLHSKPWDLAGIETDEKNPTMCWQWWAFDLIHAQRSAAAKAGYQTIYSRN